MNYWEQVKQKLAAQLRVEAYQNWVAKTSQDRIDGETLLVRLPNDFYRESLEGEYAPLILTAIQDLGLPITGIRYHAPNAVQPRPSDGPTEQQQPPRPVDPAAPATVGQLNPKFTFDSFVVGSCNQFAHAAARAVATHPSRSYNPLFIYGGVGMGKTHLMHAIGMQLKIAYTGMRIVYTSSERFMNEMINCIKTERMPLFHQHYRTADVLLVDDIQILGGKERTQEEFFHTFNELYEHQKQIVISSDSTPKEIPGLVDRLRSRFEWGLMVDVQPPDLETKMAILDKKAEAEGIHLPEDVRIFIATKTKSNVRELEGALVKLMAFSSMTSSPITLSMAQQMLKHMVHGAERRTSAESIIRAVADRYNLQPAQLKIKTNAHHIALPRQVAMYLIKELTQASLPEIGRLFGGKHHTTVLHSVHKIEELRHKDRELNSLLHSLLETFH
jgi:chromosomal replication initiator protein